MYGFIGRCIHVFHACGYSIVSYVHTVSVWQSEPIPARLACPLEYEYCRDVFCTNNGRCIHGECVCSPGYTGAGCEFEICTDGCPYYGHCVHDKCYCPNFTSQQNECDQYFTLCDFGPPCLNNGTCGTSSCTCAHGYTGLYCEIEVCNVNCLNGATCHIDSCECPKGWKGQQCEIREAVTAKPPHVTNPPQVRPCPLEIETSDEGVFEWPQTQVGGVARLPCPCPMNPALTEGIFAVRKCVSSTLWGEPDWTACTLSEKTKQLCNVRQEELLTVVKNVTSDTSTLKAGDVALLVSAVDALSAIEDNVNDVETRDNLLNVVDDILSVNSAVLEETSETSDTSEKIVDVFDKIAAKVQLTNGELKVKKDNFVLEVKETTVSDIPEEGFTPDFSAESNNKAVLPKSLFESLNLSTDNSLRISSSVIDKPTLFKGRDKSVTVSSSIISISVVGMTVAGLETPIELTFQKIPTNTTLPDSKMTCQFWNVTLDDGLGAWSVDGCYVMEESELNVKCACNHLTGFAIIETQGDTSTANQSEDAVVIAFPAAAGGVFIIGIVAVGLVLFAIQWKMRSRRQISNHHHPVDAVIANEYATTTM